MILERINEPRDLRALSNQDLTDLASEIRELLVGTVSETGGHISSNLGTVELTLALHRSFDSPVDKLVWDVGHQAYVHKLVTGRWRRFNSIRQFEGLCGYLERSESPHDMFGAGHAGTSISAALGMALARDMAGLDHHVTAIIGDGALTTGMALEALNHTGHLGTRLIVVLNDNNMSISPNVGAMNRAFYDLRLGRAYMQARERIEKILMNLPKGGDVWQAGELIKRNMKGLMVPSVIWESLGFYYIGPIDGHNRELLEAAFEHAKGVKDKPVFIHAMTVKGKGHPEAEMDSIKWHGVSAKGPKPSIPTPPSYSKVFASSFAKIAKEDKRVVAITAAMLEGTGLQTIVDEVAKEQIVDVGICEQHAVTLAGGLATQGFVPIAAIYSTFLQRGYDQIIHDIALQNLHVVFALDRGGLVGDDGKTHQGIFDFSFLRLIPNMVVSAPKDEEELQHLLYTGVMHDGPFTLRFPRGNGTGASLSEKLQTIPIGTGEILRSGNDVSIIGIGATVAWVMEAAEELSRAGIDCEVINARFVKPLDERLILESARRTKRIVTVEENVLSGGFGSAVSELLHDNSEDGVELLRIGLPDQFIEHGSQAILRNKYAIDAENIVAKVRKFVAPVLVERSPVSG